MAGVQAALAKVEEALKLQGQQVADLSRATSEAVDRSEGLLNAAAERVERSSSSAAQLLAKDVREGTATDLTALGSRLDELFSDAGSAGRLFAGVAASVGQLQRTAEVELNEWKGQANTLGEEVAVLRGVAETAKLTEASLEESRGQVAELQAKMDAPQQ
eukprot:SRR837773.11145.p3 GENE.SRR837773.11145~~SRR837773.11145.p3  ORF type:complete len:183 (+),score=75.34 SRR837773.11145:71-550(+)